MTERSRTPGLTITPRWLAEGKELTPAPTYQYRDHQRVMMLTILHAKHEKVRQNADRDLLIYADKVREYTLAAITELEAHQPLGATELFVGPALAASCRTTGSVHRELRKNGQKLCDNYIGETVAGVIPADGPFSVANTMCFQINTTYFHRAPEAGGDAESAGIIPYFSWHS